MLFQIKELRNTIRRNLQNLKKKKSINFSNKFHRCNKFIRHQNLTQSRFNIKNYKNR